MKLTGKLLGMFLVALGDFASGILIAHILIKITGYRDIAPLPIYIAAAVIAVSPDIDIALHKIMISAKPEKISEHRDLLHKPWFIIPAFAILYPFSAFWAYLAGLCMLAHFVHDSTGSGYGIKWFQPFSQSTYKFCARRIICKWTPKEVAENPFMMKLDDWLEEYYLKPTAEGCAGIILAFITLIIILIW